MSLIPQWGWLEGQAQLGLWTEVPKGDPPAWWLGVPRGSSQRPSANIKCPVDDLWTSSSITFCAPVSDAVIGQPDSREIGTRPQWEEGPKSLAIFSLPHVVRGAFFSQALSTP